jgi:hypothetical protein
VTAVLGDAKPDAQQHGLLWGQPLLAESLPSAASRGEAESPGGRPLCVRGLRGRLPTRQAVVAQLSPRAPPPVGPSAD